MKVVTIGGGTGQFTLLSALKDFDIDLTAIVSMVDSGGSTGRLRDEYGILPPGDILKCLIALSSYKEARQILQIRFLSNEKLKNHNPGNLLLVFLYQYLGGNFIGAVEALGEILNIKGRVLPVTTDKATLVAELETGELIYSEAEIDTRKKSESIKRTFLVPHSGKLEINLEAKNKIEEADYIFIGPGDLFTSITPNFLVPGVKESIKNSKSKIIYILNIMTKFGETNGFSASLFQEKIENYLGRTVDFILINNRLPSAQVLEKYKEERAQPVQDDLPENKNFIRADLIAEKGLARHDVDKLKKVIIQILN